MSLLLLYKISITSTDLSTSPPYKPLWPFSSKRRRKKSPTTVEFNERSASYDKKRLNRITIKVVCCVYRQCWIRSRNTFFWCTADTRNVRSITSSEKRAFAHKYTKILYFDLKIIDCPNLFPTVYTIHYRYVVVLLVYCNLFSNFNCDFYGYLKMCFQAP